MTSCILGLSLTSLASDDLELGFREPSSSIQQKLFPLHHEFPDAQMSIRTPLSRGRLQPLVEGLMRLKEGLLKNLPFATAVSGDQNQVLRAYIYGDKASFKQYQQSLFQLAPNNGGIYIESRGTLYTFDRFPYEDFYSMEELLRHEYVHYLTGRYLVPGNWGKGEFYRSGQMVWLEEGIAEAWAGEIADSMPVFRPKLIKLMCNDEEPMAIGDVISSQYNDGFRFYRYAGALVDYLQSQEPKVWKALLTAVRDQSLPSYRQQLAKLKTDSVLAGGFQVHLRKLKDDVCFTPPQLSHVSADDASTTKTTAQRGPTQ